MLFRYCFCALLLLSASFAQAQKLPKPKINEKDWAKMSKIEDSLVVAAAMMQLDTLTTDSTATRTLSQLALDTLSEKWRTAAAAQVLGMVRRALRTKNSFDYPFEHTRQFSILYPTNRAFRLVTWQNFVNSTTYKYYGFIQFANGKVVYLQDKKKTLRSPQNKKLKPENWYGALYYRLQEFKLKGKVYYMVFGFDSDSFFSHTKLLDILTIENGTSVTFGAPIFDFRPEEVRKMDKDAAAHQTHDPYAVAFTEQDAPHRFFLDYAAESVVSLTYDPELKMVKFDHVVPAGQTKYGMRYIPDSDIDGLAMKNGKWTLKERLFTQTMDEAPRPIPILDQRDDGIVPTKKRIVPKGDPLQAKP